MGILYKNKKLNGFLIVLTTFLFSLNLNQWVSNYDLDPSWQNSYNQFAHTSLQYGSDIIFTYGPLAWWSLYAFDSQLYWGKVAYHIFLSLYICFIMFLFYINYRKFPLFLFLLGIVFFRLNDSLLMFLQLVSFFFILVYIDKKGNKRLRRMCIAILFTPLVITGMIKFTFMVTAFALVSLLMLRCIISNKWRLGVVFLLVWCIGSILVWFSSGQNFTSFFHYIKYGLEISKGYNEAMAVIGPSVAIQFALLLSLIFILTLPVGIIVNISENINEIITLIAICFFSFISWKHGFVRHDMHQVSFFTFMGFVPSILVIINSKTNNIVSLQREWILKRYPSAHNDVVTIITTPIIRYLMCAFLLIGSIFGVYYSFYKENFAQKIVSDTFNHLKNNLVIVLNPSIFLEQKNRLEEESKKMKVDGELPIIKSIVGKKEVDIYNYNQNYLIYNSFNWHPRPIFQSYSSYTPLLLEINKSHIVNNPPDFVLMNIQTIDNRYPLLDDSLWIREVFDNYVPKAVEKGFVLFEKKKGDATSQKLTDEVVHHTSLGQDIAIQKNNKFSYLKLDVQYSKLGKIRALFFKPPEIYISVKLREGGEKKFRIIPGMAEEPFLLSPLIETNTDLLNSLAKLNPKNVESFRVECEPGMEKFFDDSITAKVYNINIQTTAKKEVLKLLWNGISNRTPIDVVSDLSIDRITLGNSESMFFHPRAQVVFNKKFNDNIVVAEVGMRQEAIGLNKSDGVTFYWEVLNDNHKWEVINKSFIKPSSEQDISKLEIKLPQKSGLIRLRVDSGPKGDSSWDWAFVKSIRFY